MPATARTGALIYAERLVAVSTFYERVSGASVIHADADHEALESPDGQLIISSQSKAWRQLSG